MRMQEDAALMFRAETHSKCVWQSYCLAGAYLLITAVETTVIDVFARELSFTRGGECELFLTELCSVFWKRFWK